MRLCEWCKIKLAFDGELCSDCTVSLAQKDEAHKAHSAVDAHMESCTLCRCIGRPCSVAHDLVANAYALDGRIDKEYAEVFGHIDPVQWFWQNVGNYDKEGPFPHG